MVCGKSTIPDPRDEQHCQLCLDSPPPRSVLGYSKLRPNGLVVHTQLHPSNRLNCIVPLVSSPYSFSCHRKPKDAEDQLEAASGAASAITRVHAVPYSVGRLCSQLYTYDYQISRVVKSFVILIRFAPLAPLETLWTGCIKGGASNTLMRSIFATLGP